MSAGGAFSLGKQLSLATQDAQVRTKRIQNQGIILHNLAA